jgi:hypothetical protein
LNVSAEISMKQNYHIPVFTKFYHINLQYQILILPPTAFTLLKASFTDVLLLHTHQQSALPFVNL